MFDCKSLNLKEKTKERLNITNGSLESVMDAAAKNTIKRMIYKLLSYICKGKNIIFRNGDAIG